MKLSSFWLVNLLIYLKVFTVQAAGLQLLEKDRELRGLVKIKLHGEPLKLMNEEGPYYNATKSLAFSPDGKHIAVSFTPGPIIIYDITTEKTKRFDHELEKMKQDAKRVVLK